MRTAVVELSMFKKIVNVMTFVRAKQHISGRKYLELIRHSIVVKQYKDFEGTPMQNRSFKNYFCSLKSNVDF